MQTRSYGFFWICVLTLLYTLSTAAQTWRQVGPPGGDVQSLAAVPGSTRTLFLGTSDGHIFGSQDGGEHWQQLGRIGANHDDVIMSIVVDARSADTLYATSWTLSSHGGGVYRSTDAGRNWQLIGLDGHMVRACTARPIPGKIGHGSPRKIIPTCATSIPSRLTRTIQIRFMPVRTICPGKRWTAEKTGHPFIREWWTIPTS